VKLGIVLPLFSGDPERVGRRARRAEQLGFDGVFAFDHFFPPGAPGDEPSLEAFTTLAAIAAVTERVAVGTLVTRVTLRPPGLIAKMAASLDAMSSGRMLLGIGTGDALNDAESEAFGFPTPSADERRGLLEEAVRSCRALFAGEAWPGGEHVPALAGPLAPPPARAGGPPIWVGGTSPATVRLAGRIGDAWNGWGLDADRFDRRVAMLRESAQGAERDVPPTWAGLALVGADDADLRRLRDDRQRHAGEHGLEPGVWSGTPSALVERLRRFATAGATWSILMLAGPADRIDLVAETVMPAVGEMGP
jgi:alkanesulfonate monooxygenase SsuD/methylene tetrahydromethanopterin reductase-like flavin-dependent oxidoreductase (luciferase family)